LEYLASLQAGLISELPALNFKYISFQVRLGNTLKETCQALKPQLGGKPSLLEQRKGAPGL